MKNTNAPQSQSNQLVLNKALDHLANYYIKLTKDKLRPKFKSNVLTLDGEYIQGLLAIQQDERIMYVSVTACDTLYFNKRRNWLAANIDIPQPDMEFITLISVILFSLLSFFLYDDLGFGAFVLGLLSAAGFALLLILNAEDLGRKLKKAPSSGLYCFLPTIDYPTNEDWLVVESATFTLNPDIKLASLKNVCAYQGIGLMIIDNEGYGHVYNDPEHHRRFVEAKYEN